MKMYSAAGIAAVMLVCTLLPFGSFAETPSQLFGDMDTDGDQRISQEEFVGYGAKTKKAAGKPFNEAAAKESFANRDADGDGYLSQEEMSQKTPASDKQKMSLEEQKKKIGEAKQKKEDEEKKRKAEEEKRKEERRRKAEEAKKEKQKKNKDDGGGGNNDD